MFLHMTEIYFVPERNSGYNMGVCGRGERSFPDGMVVSLGCRGVSLEKDLNVWVLEARLKMKVNTRRIWIEPGTELMDRTYNDSCGRPLPMPFISCAISDQLWHNHFGLQILA